MSLPRNSPMFVWIDKIGLSSASRPGFLCIAVIVLFLMQRLFSWWTRYRNLPIYGKDDKDMRKALTQGYEKGELFGIPTPVGVHLFLPPKFIAELNQFSDDELNLEAQFALHTLEGTTKFSKTQPLFAQITHKGINRNARGTVQILEHGIRGQLEQIVGSCSEWTSFNASDLIKQIAMAGCNLVSHGPELGVNGIWLSEVEGYLDDAMHGLVDVMNYPQLLHPILALFNSKFRRLPSRLRYIKQTLRPVLDQYRKSEKKRVDGIQWGWDYANKEQQDLEYQALTQIILYYFNSIFIMPTLVALVYDLVSHPECIEPLREEIRQVFGDGAAADFTPSKLDQLLKLDSFLKESQRVATPILYTKGRMAQKEVRLKSGAILAPGTPLGVPLWPLTHDPEFWEEPDMFDPWRHEKLGQQQGNHIDNLMTAVRPGWLLWGRGRHACPGRFFVVHVIKITAVMILSRYDMQFADGVAPIGGYIGWGYMPDSTAKILLRAAAAL
ncbi:hypothetical protein N7516_004108 [Penicillium verrucosum]|uniref:uncharacterized protein n=1 Tax=Penicillium verrucosum TaxID=60171 RepID=UPI00254593D0|nr:uncharacterized protein N7516_004108 [Penicillium verrucosum]KAJ5943940.1 hypothetical protein N7516_004108 [Penicillium verrucosum]